MKYFALALLLSVSTLYSFSQKNQDVLFLQNGSVIHGKILESDSNRVKIKTQFNDIFVYPAIEVERIAVESATAQYPIKEFGYLNFTSIGTVFGSALNEKPTPFCLDMEHNFRISKNFAFGVTSGLEMLNEMTAPVGGNIKLLVPWFGGNSFYYGISGGYSISLEKPKYIDDYYEISKAYGGILFNTEVGIIYPLKENLSFYLAAGYRYNELHYKRKDWWYNSVDRAMYFNRISLKIGLAFY
jgi:hypothetical protein